MELDNSAWEYNAPQFVDFTQPIEDSENVEEYFNYDHENGGIPTSFNASETGTPSRDSYPLRSKCNTPQQQKTPGRNTPRRTPSRATPSRATPSGSTPRGTPGRSALKDTNNLTPRRSTRLKSDETSSPQTESKAPNMTPQDSMSEKENISTGNYDDVPHKPLSFLSKAKGMINRVLPNLITDVDEWNRNKTKTRTSKPEPTKKTGVSQKRRSEAAKPSPKITDSSSSSSKKLRRSASAALTRPRVSISDAKSLSNKHSRTNSAQSRGQQRRPSTQSPIININKPQAVTSVCKTHIRTNSGQSRPHVRTSSGQSRPHVKTNSAQSRPHVRTNSAQTRPHNRTGSAQSIKISNHVRSNSAQTSRQRTHSFDQSSRLEVGRKSNTVRVKPKLTVPMTPVVLKHQDLMKSSNKMKTTEQMELDQVKKLRKQLAEKRKLAEDSLKMAQNSHGYAPVRSIQATTKVEGFNFATDERIKTHERKRTEEVDFTASLRSRTRKSSGGKKSETKPSLTVVEPFNLHENKRKEMPQSEKYHSDAEIMRAFSSKTPDRFHTKPHNKDSSVNMKRRSGTSSLPKPTITIPRTPNFETRGRIRPPTVQSQAELDEKELEEIKKYKFRARPVNDKILKNPNCGLHKVAPKECTKFESFDLETDRRIRERLHNKSESEEQSYEFHAKPIPKNMLEGPTGIKIMKEIPLTKPASPAFALKSRLRTYREQAEKMVSEEPKHPAVRAKPVPHMGIPFQPKLSHKVTEPEPFSGVEIRNRLMRARRQDKIRQVLENERKGREFHANPLPNDVPDVLPVVSVKPPTVSEPFNIEHHKAEDWAQKMEEEMRTQRAKANFKAKPATSLYRQPFIPKRSTKILTDVQEFDLSTERRQGRWAELQQHKYEKEVEIAAVQCATEKRKRDEEEEVVKRLRAEAVHVAKPVRSYKPVEVLPSNKPLTLPETPRFSERLRSRVPDKS